MVEAFTIRTLVLSLLVFSGIAIGMTNFYGSLIANSAAYGSQYEITDVQNLSTLDVTAEIVNTTADMEFNLRDMNALETAYFIAVSAPLTALNMIWNSVGLFNALVTDSISLLGFPSWLSAIIWTSILLFVIYEVLSLVFRWRV